MSLITPTEGQLRAANRNAAPLDLLFVDDAGKSQLSLRDQPNSMLLTITNRSARSFIADRDATFSITMRPRTLLEPGAVALSEDAAVTWALRTQPAEDASSIWFNQLGGTESSPVFQMLTISPRSRMKIAPGESWHCRFEGLAGDPSAGTRRTRVVLAYEGLATAREDHKDPDALLTSIDGQVTRHLSMSRTDNAAMLRARSVRTGSTSRAGPFTAGFTMAPVVLNDGKALNQLSLRVVNTSGRPLPVSGDDDLATRLVLEYRIGNSPADWGLLRSRHDHFVATTKNPDWMSDGVKLRRRSDGVWRRSEPLDIDLEIHTSAPAGTTQLVVRFENLPDDDDGELLLLVQVAESTANAFTKPLEVWGNDGAIDFHAGEYLAAPEQPAAKILLDHHDHNTVRPPLRIISSELDVGPFSYGQSLRLGAVDSEAGPSRYGFIETDRARLEINASGGPVTVGGRSLHGRTNESLNPSLDVAGPLRVSARTDVPSEIHLGHDDNDGVGKLRIGHHNGSNWIRSRDAAPLKINASGGIVALGPGAAIFPADANSKWSFDVSARHLLVSGLLRISGQIANQLLIGENQRGTPMLKIGQKPNASGIDDGKDYIESDFGRELLINSSGSPVQIGAGAKLVQNADLACENMTVKNLRVENALQIGNLIIGVNRNMIWIGKASTSGFEDGFGMAGDWASLNMSKNL